MPHAVDDARTTDTFGDGETLADIGSEPYTPGDDPDTPEDESLPRQEQDDDDGRLEADDAAKRGRQKKVGGNE